MKKVVLLISLNLVVVAKSNVYLYDCPVEYSVMNAIAKNERHPKREVGYPYIISFNGKIPTALESLTDTYDVLKCTTCPNLSSFYKV